MDDSDPIFEAMHQFWDGEGRVLTCPACGSNGTASRHGSRVEFACRGCGTRADYHAHSAEPEYG